MEGSIDTSPGTGTQRVEGKAGESDAAARRREQILDAALEVFSELGYHRASMREISRRAGLKSPAHLYFYFDSKAHLYAEVAGWSAPSLDEVALSKAALERSPERALASIARGYLRLFDRPETVRLFRMVLSEAASEPEIGAEYISGVNRSVLRLVEDFFAERARRGDFRPLDPRSTAIWFLWQLIGYVEIRELFAPLHAELPPLDEYVEQVVDNVVHGLRPRDDDAG